MVSPNLFTASSIHLATNSKEYFYKKTWQAFSPGSDYFIPRTSDGT
jgi:hypothetical protein